MRRVNRKWKVIGVLSIIGFIVFCIEVLSFVVNTRSWVHFQDVPDSQDLHENESLRILIVADPQIQGEKQESQLFGWLTRWDSDRYLYKNYRLAKHHVQPHLILFLGDLFDEGSKAADEEYKRYYRRFANIFDLPTKSEMISSKNNYIFLPGDNDVGGEAGEVIDVKKLRMFNETFGEYRGVFWLRNSGWNTQFFKMNMFLPDVYKNPTKGLDAVLNSEMPDYRIVLSHISLLSFITQSVETVIEKIRPTMIITAHNHRSTFYQYEKGTGSENSLRVTPEFLVGHRSQSKQGSSTSTVKSRSNDAIALTENTSIRFHMKRVPEQNRDSIVYEINVPTCSYRMGVKDMGFGSMQIFNNGTVDYTVLWLPSRFKQLYFYLFFYILGKLIVTPWLLCKLACFSIHRFQMWRNTKDVNYHVI